MKPGSSPVPIWTALAATLLTAGWYFAWSKAWIGVAAFAVVILLVLLAGTRLLTWLATRGEDPFSLADKAGRFRAMESGQQIIGGISLFAAILLTAALPLITAVILLSTLYRLVTGDEGAGPTRTPWWTIWLVAATGTGTLVYAITGPDWWSGFLAGYVNGLQTGFAPIHPLLAVSVAMTVWGVPKALAATTRTGRKVIQERRPEVEPPNPASNENLTRMVLESRTMMQPFFPLGRALDIDNGTPLDEVVGIYGAEIATHGILTGATGSGKTETIKRIVDAATRFGWDVTVIDLKNDTGVEGLEEYCEQLARELGLSYQSWSNAFDADDYTCYFNPLHGLPLDAQKGVLVDLQEFEAAHWAALGKQRLSDLLIFLAVSSRLKPDKWEAPTMKQIGDYLKEIGAGQLDDVSNALRGVARGRGGRPLTLPELKEKTQPGSVAREFIDRYETIIAATDEDLRRNGVVNPTEYRGPGLSREAQMSATERGTVEGIFHLTKDQQQAAAGLGERITNSFTSEADLKGAYSPRNGKPALDLINTNIVYIGLASLNQEDTTSMLAAAALRRYAAESDNRQGFKERHDLRPRLLVVDEAATVPINILDTMLKKLRSFGYYLLLSVQSALDWGPEEWEIIVNNVNFGIFMRQPSGESKLRTAEYIGKHRISRRARTVSTDRDTWTEGYAWSGGVRESWREDESVEYRVDPELIHHLPVGEAVLKITSSAIRPQEMVDSEGHPVGYCRRVKVTPVEYRALEVPTGAQLRQDRVAPGPATQALSVLETIRTMNTPPAGNNPPYPATPTSPFGAPGHLTPPGDIPPPVPRQRPEEPDTPRVVPFPET